MVVGSGHAGRLRPWQVNAASQPNETHA